MSIYEFNGYRPVIHESSFIHPLAAVTGNVTIGKNVYIGPGAALRGDWGELIISDGCNIQENCTFHVFPATSVTLREDSHIGHGAIIHGGKLGRNILVGMNSIIMDEVIIGDDCFVGAMSFVKEGTVVPDRKLIAGNPAIIIKNVSEEMLFRKNKGTALYQTLPAEMFATWKECEPLRKSPEVKPIQQERYKDWKK